MAAVTAATRAMGMSSSEAGHGHEWDYAVPANQEVCDMNLKALTDNRMLLTRPNC